MNLLTIYHLFHQFEKKTNSLPLGTNNQLEVLPYLHFEKLSSCKLQNIASAIQCFVICIIIMIKFQATKEESHIHMQQTDRQPQNHKTKFQKHKVGIILNTSRNRSDDHYQRTKCCTHEIYEEDIRRKNTNGYAILSNSWSLNYVEPTIYRSFSTQDFAIQSMFSKYLLSLKMRLEISIQG